MDAIEILRGTAPHPESPLPWRLAGRRLVDANDEDLGAPSCEQDGKHIAAAVNAAPVLLAEVDRLRAQLAASEQARSDDAMELLRCQSAMREWMVLSEKADDREVKARKDAEQLRAQLAAAREAVAEMRQDHRNDCARINLGQWGRDCDCGLTEILTARRALGLEV